MQDFIRTFREVIETAEQRLLEISEAQAEVCPGPGQWSAKEILGHLIDSAANNHRRFVEAQLKDDLVFPGYEQESWVAVQRYQRASWAALIALWKAYNLHLIQVVSSIPESELRRGRGEHTLDKIAWQTVSEDTPASLEYLIRDYFGHLQDHLGQIFSNSQTEPPGGSRPFRAIA
jgi:hypothetical protein